MNFVTFGFLFLFRKPDTWPPRSTFDFRCFESFQKTGPYSQPFTVHHAVLVILVLTAKKVIAATNRPDVLDPALLRSGRLDRKIELPHPSEEARGRILQIHSRKMNVDKGERSYV